MIRVYVKRTTTGDIASFTIDGHAGYAEPGQDIVCAAVSGISFGTINAIQSLLSVELPIKQGEDGFLSCKVPRFKANVHEKIQLLLDGMIASLQSVAFEYGQFVTVTDDQNKNR